VFKSLLQKKITPTVRSAESSTQGKKGNADIQGGFIETPVWGVLSRRDNM
jgi:hypothetical protein